MSDQLSFPVITMPNGKIYHESAEDFQRAFHKSKAKFRWLGGGVGAGKSAAATIEILRHCWEYPNNYGFVLRKTFPELRLSAIKDFYEICPGWMIVEDNRQEHWVDVYNHVGFKFRKQFWHKVESGQLRKREYLKALKDVKGTSRVEFISFEGTEAAEAKFRSANIGWYMIEQAEEATPINYDRLNERLRRVPAARQAWFISNPDGRDWLWDFFSPDSETQRPNHEMFEVELTDNSNLPKDFHETLRDTYSEEDYARLVEGSFDIATGAVFPEFSYDIHQIPHFEPPDEWKKAFSLDHGLREPTAAVYMAKFPTGEIYIYQEYYEKGKYVGEHANALKPTLTPEHQIKTIDPTCINREPILGATVISEYARHGIYFIPGVRDVMIGVNRIKEYMTFDPERMNPVTEKLGSPRLFISDRCPILAREIQRYKWETLKTDRGSKNNPEKPKDFFDHLISGLRWGLVAFAPFLSSKSYVPEHNASRQSSYINVKENKLITLNDKDEPVVNISSLIKDAEKVRNSRAASWR